ELAVFAPLRRRAQQQHRVPLVAVAAAEGAPELGFDDRARRDHHVTICQLISNSASGLASAASQMDFTRAGTSRAWTRGPGKESGPGAISAAGRCLTIWSRRRSRS